MIDCTLGGRAVDMAALADFWSGSGVASVEELVPSACPDVALCE